MDPLNDVLAVLDMRSAQFARLEATGAWAISFLGYQHIKLGAVLDGACWVETEGERPVRVADGDCYLLGNGRPYRLSSDPAVPAQPSSDFFAGFVEGSTVRVGPSDSHPDAVVVGCGFHLDTANAAVLLDVLPPLVHVPAASEEADAIRTALNMLRKETATTEVGSLLIVERLAHIVLVQVLRSHIAAQGPTGQAWLTALADPAIATALGLIHETPAHPWTVAELAAKAGMSRSHLAARFSELVGTPPLEYLATWRIRSAARELRSGNRTIASIAAQYGYNSDSAFSHAFKRVTGMAPGRYRRQARLASSSS
ncbi:AraC family transcriptional regulator [Streptomyces sp. NBC_00365]|uniref:AraC family transcriptional regulator n=1 Tax=Streptomyces sp. NBC_00365 TaxID=2975726 RepID=UPI00225520AF|nr:AraC family transcriptional regulator [Streptomyces sp. NBC_00365]MCX5097062.1 AraC family transcriptional regulator [Streptomyces sp. NBC_00365]